MYRLHFLGRKLGELILTLLVASFVIFASLYAAPGSIVSFLVGPDASPETVALVREQYHLDEPFLSQYWRWLQGILSGQLGNSLLYQEPISVVLAGRLQNTLWLLSYTIVLLTVFGVGLGIVAALRPGVAGRVIVAATSLLLGIPSFVLAIVLILVGGVTLGWFPVVGGGGEGVMDRLWHLTLPSIALASFGVAYVSRLTTAAIREEMASEFVATARIRGLPSATVFYRHVLRNSLITILTAAGVTVSGLLAGSTVIETAFGIDGVAGYLVKAVHQKDFPVVQAIVLMFVATFVIVNVVIDLLYVLIDPRIALRGF